MRTAAFLLLAAASSVPAAVFNGSTSFGYNSSVTIGATHTYCAWINPAGGGEGNAGRIIDVNGNLGFRIDGSATLAVWYDSTSLTVAAIGSTAVPLNAWTHVCAMRVSGDGGPRIYIGNATAAMAESSYSSRTDAGTAASGALAAYIGNRAANDRTFNGGIAGVRIYSATLTVAQMDAIRRGFEPSRAYLQNHWPLTGNPVSSSDAIGTAALTLSNVSAGGNPPLARPWGWWSLVLPFGGWK